MIGLILLGPSSEIAGLLLCHVDHFEEQFLPLLGVSLALLTI
jgi:hypothetical protein